MTRSCARLVLAAAALAIAAAFPAAAFAFPQENDSFSAATELTGNNGFEFGANLKATKEPGEPDHAGNPGGASLWYRWVAPATGPVVFNAFGDTMDPLLAVYTGASIDGLTEIASNDDSGEQTLNSRVAFTSVAGTEYRIAVDGYNGATGFFEIGWLVPPENDDFAQAVEIAASAGTLASSNLGATEEPGEPEHADCGSASVWYRWTAPVSEDVRFDTRGTEFDTTLAVYTGTAVDALTSVASNDDFQSLASDLSFEATVGTTYAIAVAGCGGDAGGFTLNWTPGAIIFGTGNGELLTGTPGRDYIAGGGGNDTIRGLGGPDEITGQGGADHLYGGRGADRLVSRDGRNGNDVIVGGRGHDTAVADRGDVIRGVP